MFNFKGSLLLVAVWMLGFSSSWAQQYVPGEMIVKLKGSHSTAKAKQFYGKMSSKVSLKASFGGLNVHHMVLKPGQDMAASIAELRQDPDVEYVEPNYLLNVIAPDKGDNRLFSLEEAQSTVSASAAGTYSQSYAPVKVTEGWAAATASSSVTPVVAVIDTGVDYNHTVFTGTGAIWTNPGETGTDSQGRNKATNGVDDDGNGYVDDVRGWNFVAGSNAPMDDDEHGTHVAGIILGVTQDIFASTLTPAKIRIMPLKFLNASGSGSTSDAINAIYYAVRNGANIINNSWGGSSYSQSLHDALAYAYNNRVTVIAAAGNAASNNDSVAMYPANYPVPSLISVAATTDSDNLASFSNYGRNYVHVAAPGSGIFSTVPGNSYRYMSGTSMAAPFVAGMAAMVFREAWNLTGYQVKNIITSTVNPISSLSTVLSTGGRVNDYNAITSAKLNSSVSASQPVYVASAPVGYRDPASSTTTTTGGCGLVSALSAGGLGGGSAGAGGASAVVVLMLLPLAVMLYLKKTAQREAHSNSRRQHERFVMNSSISLKVGDRELQGQVKTISEGGVSFCADSMLEKGGIVTMMITSPDGREQVQVQGHVVWNEQNGAYGVKFDEAKDSVLDHIRNWSRNLAKAS